MFIGYYFYLDLACTKTRKSYHTSHKVATAEFLESSSNLPTLLSNVALRRSKREKRKRISQHRFSFIQKTSTSRYREFVEHSIREIGLIDILQKIRNLLHLPLNKAKYCLTDPSEVSMSTHKKDDLFGSYLPTLMKIFLKLHDKKITEFISLLEKDAASCKIYSQYSKALHDMNLPTFSEVYSFLILVPMDIIHECVRFRIDYKPKVEPSHLSIRQVI